jgi:hypothetical protein
MTGRKFYYNCNTQGCFNEKHRAQLFEYDGCFQGNNQMSDVDGQVEINGYLLQVEWKMPRKEISKGQLRTFEKMSNGVGGNRFVGIVVEGHPAVNIVYRFFYVSNGRASQWLEGGVDALKDIKTSWNDWAGRPKTEKPFFTYEQVFV